VIHIDRVRANVDVVGGQGGDGRPRPEPALSIADLDRVSRDRFRDLVLEVLRDHLRDLERRGVL
jgi:hypothetical protein